jgi:hypothetical protein
MICISCGNTNGWAKKTCGQCGAVLVGETINNVTGKFGRRNADGSFTPYQTESDNIQLGIPSEREV